MNIKLRTGKFPTKKLMPSMELLKKRCGLKVGRYTSTPMPSEMPRNAKTRTMTMRNTCNVFGEWFTFSKMPRYAPSKRPLQIEYKNAPSGWSTVKKMFTSVNSPLSVMFPRMMILK